MHTCNILSQDGCKECERERENWQSCCRAANRLADLVCMMYHPKDSQARVVFPTATWSEIIASELGIQIPE